MAAEINVEGLANFDRDAVIRELEEKGYAVIPDVCSAQDCDMYISQYRDWLSQFKEDECPYQGHSIIQGYDVGHFENTWNCRIKAKPVFAKVWETEKLHTSFDAIAISEPPEARETGMYDTGKKWLHLDQPAQRIGLHGYQGALYLEETTETDYCFRVLSGSHKHFSAFFEEFEASAKKSNIDKFYMLREDDKSWFKERGCVTTKVPVPKGGMVLWDSRTVHDNCRPEKGRPNSDRWRFVVFVCMTPAKWARPEDISDKKKAYNHRLMTGHWPSQGIIIFEKSDPPSDHSKIKSPIGNSLPEVAATKEAKLLSGVEEYDFSDGEPNGPSWEPVWKKNTSL
ncbi:uncharacterized protein LOC124257096 isoform X1 [Haliotis rubra]|uniref:uncharacterized protein LOC124257096 isoform X1 n=1 Tax=Haliotis rubra TaxID=36100 RepID=UPI001EE5F028|nr:uncharacterized protein LOC124257096 isoform X1 [Haliotis rubra]